MNHSFTKHLLASLLVMLFSMETYAQELKVISFEPSPFDLTAATNTVNDLNGKACGLVKVRLAASGAMFEGNIIGEVKAKPGEYLVYLTEGTYKMNVLCPNCLPLSLNFRDYGIQRIMSKQTYILTLQLPNSDNKQPTASSQVSVKITEPEAVDLGLSVKWASFNLGASRPEEYGAYYKFGETTPADDKGWATYKYAKGSEFTLTKYCSDSNYGYDGFTDGKKVLEPMDDVAAVKLGGKWRMPTEAEVKELIKKCKRKAAAINGVKGIQVIGPNGNSIFLPFSGSHDSSKGLLEEVGEEGFFWSATVGEARCGRNSYYKPREWGIGKAWCTYAFPIRPVLGK